MGLLTRIMMKWIQRNITRHKEKAKTYFKKLYGQPGLGFLTNAS